MPIARQWLSSHHVLPQQMCTQQEKSCWKRCFLCGPCQAYIYKTRTSETQSLQADSQLRVAAAGRWGQGQFGQLEEGDRLPLEAATQYSENRNWEH
jgi:hypothetical protein